MALPWKATAAGAAFVTLALAGWACTNHVQALAKEWVREQCHAEVLLSAQKQQQRQREEAVATEKRLTQRIAALEQQLAKVGSQALAPEAAETERRLLDVHEGSRRLSRGDSWESYLTEPLAQDDYALRWHKQERQGKVLKDEDTKTRAKRLAAFGHEEELWALLRNGSWHLADIALSSAAFAEIAFLPQNPSERNNFMEAIDAQRMMQAQLQPRISIVRKLFSQGATGNRHFVDRAFQKIRENQFEMEESMMKVLAWGTIRDMLHLGKASVHPASKRHCLKFSEYTELLLQGFGLRGFSRMAKIEAVSSVFDLKDTPHHVLDYVIGHPQALEERNSDSWTMLMEAFGHDCHTEVLSTIHANLSLPIDGMTDRGDSAAMLAARAGHLEQAQFLEETQLEMEMETISPVFHFPFMLPLILGLHLALVLASWLFDRLRPADGSERFAHVQAFIEKTLILTLLNTAVKYASAPEILTRPHTMLLVSWNINLQVSWPIWCGLSVVFLAYVLYDLHKASQVVAVSSGQTVTAVNLYQDPKIPMSTCIHTFLLSWIFVCVYVSALLEPVQMTLYSRALWAASLFVQAYVSSSFRPEDLEGGCSRLRLAAMGRWAVRLDDQENKELWSALLQQGRLKEKDGSAAPGLSRAEVLFRFFMCYISNGLFRIFIVYSLPVYLATCERASDFALNAFAVTFIADLDNLSADVEYLVASDVLGDDPQRLLLAPDGDSPKKV